MPKSSSRRGLVLVTGGSGFVADYCIAQLLNDGWSVRTTVQSVAKSKAVRATIGGIGAKAAEIEFVEADLNSGAGWSQAAGGAQYALHIASPVPVTDPQNDDELVRPARGGTLRVPKAARDAGIKRVVMTSSISAIIFGRGAREQPFTEEDWTDETNRGDTSPYDRAKTIARARGLGLVGGLELVTVNPGLILGPVLGLDFSASIEFVKKLLDGSIPAVPRFGFNVVDVRDAARLHVLAMTTPAAAGQRFIGSGDFYWMSEVAKMLKQGLGEKAKKVPSIPVPDFVARIAALFDPIVRGRLYELGKRRPVSSEKAKRVLGWTPRPITETVLDTARSLQASGLV
jgi:nucleoside-diphosphate-sugar epimerase